MPYGTHNSLDGPSDSDYNGLDHDHALLESLYNAVFENRFINTAPTGGSHSTNPFAPT